MGVNTIAASIDEEADTIEEVYEPYLIQLGFVDRTPRGRVGTAGHLNISKSREKIAASRIVCFEDCLLIAGIQSGRPRSSSRRLWSRLTEAGIQVLRQSSIYETDPQDRTDQPLFLNMVVEVETRLFPIQLLSRTHKIERDSGRKSKNDKGPADD